MDELTRHPGLEPLFDASDRRTITDLQSCLSVDQISRWAGSADGLYSEATWRTLGKRGLFRLGMPDDRVPVGADLARSVAMLSDCLLHDHRSDLDMAIYVHGLVAPYTLLFHRDRPIAARLLPDVQNGACILCTGYTDADPGRPAVAQKVPGGYRLWGHKWLSVNMPVADHAVVTFTCESDRLMAVIALDDPLIERRTLTQISDVSLYQQGAMEMNGVFVPDDSVLSAGLRRLRVWNRVMSASRLLNAVSACRSLAYLRCVVQGELSEREVVGYAFRHQPQFRRWMAHSKAQYTMLLGAIAATLHDMTENRVDEAAAAGLKALAVRRASDLAETAKVMAGGAATLVTSEIATTAMSLHYHRFSGGAEAQLIDLFATSLARQSSETGCPA